MAPSSSGGGGCQKYPCCGCGGEPTVSMPRTTESTFQNIISGIQPKSSKHVPASAQDKYFTVVSAIRGEEVRSRKNLRPRLQRRRGRRRPPPPAPVRGGGRKGYSSASSGPPLGPAGDGFCELPTRGRNLKNPRFYLKIQLIYSGKFPPIFL